MMKRVKLYLIGACALLCGCNETDKFTDLVLPGTVEFEHETYNVSENMGEARIPVLLSSVASKDIKLTISIDNRQDLLDKPDQIAQEGVHFTIPAKELTIRQGETYGYFPLIVTDDILVNENRMFDVKIESISDGAEAARISQVCRVVLKNDDFWPEVSFGKKQYTVAGTETRLVIPLNVEGGVIRTPFTVDVAVNGISATEGVDFTIEKKNFTFTQENREDSVVLNLTAPEDMAGDMVFTLRYDVNAAGITGSIPQTEIVLKKVIKYVAFGSRINWMFQGYTKISVPVAFTGIRSSRDVSARISLKSVEGDIVLEDFVVAEDLVTTKGDTVANFNFELAGGASLMGKMDAAVELEITEVIDGLPGTTTTTWVRMREAAELDRSAWTILGFSSQEAVNDGPAVAVNILDGNPNTFWHNKWGGGAAPLPHHIAVGFGGQAISVESVKIQRRMPSNRNTKTVKIDLAVDKEMMEFVEVGEVLFENVTGAAQALTFYLPSQMTAYGLRVRMPDSYSVPSCSLSEVWVNGMLLK